MSHPRTTIRHAVVDVLTSAGLPNVSRSRTAPIQGRAGLPAVCIYTLREVVELETQSGVQRRELELAIDIYARPGDGADDNLDALCNQIEIAIDADGTLGGLAAATNLQETSIGLNGDGDAATAMARLRFGVRYRTRK